MFDLDDSHSCPLFLSLIRFSEGSRWLHQAGVPACGWCWGGAACTPRQTPQTRYEVGEGTAVACSPNLAPSCRSSGFLDLAIMGSACRGTCNRCHELAGSQCYWRGGASTDAYQMRLKVRYTMGRSASLWFGPPRCMMRGSYSTNDPAGQVASACAGLATRFARMCVPSWNSVGPFAGTRSQNGKKTESEWGGRCAPTEKRCGVSMCQR